MSPTREGDRHARSAKAPISPSKIQDRLSREKLEKIRSVSPKSREHYVLYKPRCHCCWDTAPNRQERWTATFYGVGILVSDEVIARLAHTNQHAIGTLDRVQAKGRRHTVEGSAIFAADPTNSRGQNQRDHAPDRGLRAL